MEKHFNTNLKYIFSYIKSLHTYNCYGSTELFSVGFFTLMPKSDLIKFRKLLVPIGNKFKFSELKIKNNELLK